MKSEQPCIVGIITAPALAGMRRETLRARRDRSPTAEHPVYSVSKNEHAGTDCTAGVPSVVLPIGPHESP